MQTIPEEEVLSRWAEIVHSDARLDNTLRQMACTQPFLFERLSSVDRGSIPASHRGLLVIYGLRTWRLLFDTDKPKRIPMVRPTVWEAAVVRNIQWFYSLPGGSVAGNLEAVLAAIGRCRQGPLLSHVARALVQEARQRPGLYEERLELALVYFKSLVDCLDNGQSRLVSSRV